MSQPWEYINYILNNTPVKDDDIKQYNPFTVNRSLSLHWDTVLLANEMNQYPNIPKEAQLEFLHKVVSKKKRWSDWNKGKKSPKVAMLQKLYGYSEQKAKEALLVLTDEQYKALIKSIPKEGGVKK